MGMYAEETPAQQPTLQNRTHGTFLEWSFLTARFVAHLVFFGRQSGRRGRTGRF